MTPNILVVDDEPAHRQMLDAVLSAEGYTVAQAADGLDAVASVEKQFFDLVLMDIRMANLNGLEALETLKAVSPGIAVIMMTAYASVATAVEALKAGAADYLTKPVDIEELKILVAKTLDHGRLKQENMLLKERIGQRFDRGSIIGASPLMAQLFETLALVAPSEATVLITGESGTGKELIANAIHQNSARKNHGFVKLNCAALPETLLESELFGHEKGAFTGAVARKKGRFEMAHGSSIFLDEIGEMAPATQAKILRVLQQREFEPVGGSRTIQVDTRVIAATNRDLETDISEGRFREDLYYRLNVVSVTVPALRDRREDIPLLADFFLRSFAEKNRRMLKGFSPRAMDLLMRYRWPGNVRELENVVERAVILSRSDVITPDEFPESMRETDSGTPPQASETPQGRSLKEVEREMILQTLRDTGGNRTRAAEVLGISRRTLQLKLKVYGVH
jgi:two-component system response regulator HydG